MKHRFTNKVEFYITNVCNLTCNNCNRFNNYKFAGWQNWADYAETYQHWANYIELPNIVIMGGEPLLNPTVTQWIAGLHSIFGSAVQVLSNGYQLNRTPGLYDALRHNQGHVGISLHNVQHFDQIQGNIRDFLGDLIDEYGSGIGQDRQDGIYYSARDTNNMLVNVYLSNDFSQSAVIVKPGGGYTLHDSDPILAHNQCAFAQFKCYHFVRGKLYKCGPVALLPEFDQQFHLDISHADRELLNQYQPLTPALWPQKGLQFLEDLDQPIDQCKFCSQTVTSEIIYPVVKSAVKAK